MPFITPYFLKLFGEISDKTCNLRSILVDPPVAWNKERQLEYFKWAKQVVAGLLGVNQKLDDVIVPLIEDGIKMLG